MEPEMRHDGLLANPVGDELVIYDLDRHQVHRLNPTAACIWRHCDGHTTVPQLAALLPDQLDLPASEELVWDALDRLQRKHLLERAIPEPLRSGGVSRRQLIRKLGLASGAVMLLPAIESIAAPTPAVAASNTTFCIYDVKQVTPSDLPCGTVTVGSQVCGPCQNPCPATTGFIFTPTNVASGTCIIAVEATGSQCTSCPSGATQLNICKQTLDRGCWRVHEG